VREFLKKKGIELQEGSYTRQVQHGCRILADTVNLSQQALRQAKTTVGKGLDRVRQVIHEKTAPRAASTPPQSGPAPQAPKPPPQAASGAKKSRRPTAKKTSGKRRRKS
jgi:hypothetical protein